MTRRKDKPVLLGPDGKPLDRAKYAPKPSRAAVIADEARTFTVTTSAGKDISDSLYGIRLQPYQSAMYKALLGQYVVGESGPGHVHRRSLADRVNDDLRTLGIDPTSDSEPELPKSPPDLTTYADAYDAAVRLCPHDDVASTTYAKGEYQCLTCGRYLDGEAMRQRAARRPFGGMFG